MKWLSQYVDVSQISAQDIADKLTNAGLEVEKIIPLVKTKGLVIGHVLTCANHPDSDHLHITTVDVGNEVLDIVCGASNVDTNQKVIVAKIGIQVGDLLIKPVKLRGQPSNGMICSYQEIGVPEKFIGENPVDGIVVLHQDAPIGEDALAYLGLDDVLLDVAQTPNRSDVMAMNAMALEIGALLNKEVTLPNINVVDTVQNTPLQLKSTTKNCTQFLGRIIEEVTLKPSPDWIKEILLSNDIRPINNVVDISNLVMLETGQPLHFYDRTLIADEITVKDNISLDYVALDEETYGLQQEDVLITSDNQVIGIAGIMGGESSKINEDTSSIIIEVASFDRVAIRQTSRRLNLISEAATRFIKGIDPQAATTAIKRATSLLVELADAKVIHPIVALAPMDDSYTKKVSLTHTHLSELLGINLETQAILDVFERLSFQPKLINETFECIIPSYRQDIHVAADLIEEVIRVIGYDVIEAKALHLPETSGRLSVTQQFTRKLQALCMGFNLFESITYTLTNPKYASGPMALANPVSILSPLSEDRKMVRNQLFYSMLSTLSYNTSYKNKRNNMFEISQVYAQNIQQTRLGIVLYEDVVSLNVQKEKISASFYALKGMVEAIVKQAGVDQKVLEFTAIDKEQMYLHPYQSAMVHANGVTLGYIGSVHPLVSKEFDIKKTWILEMNIDALLSLNKQPVSYTTVHKFPHVEKDLAFVMSKETSLTDMIGIIITSGKPYIRDVSIFDVFESDKLGENNHSVAFNLQFVADQMYRDEQINEIIDTIVQEIQEKTGATLR